MYYYKKSITVCARYLLCIIINKHFIFKSCSITALKETQDGDSYQLVNVLAYTMQCCLPEVGMLHEA